MKSPMHTLKLITDSLLADLGSADRKAARSLARNVFELLDLSEPKVAHVAVTIAMMRLVKKHDKRRAASRKAAKR